DNVFGDTAIERISGARDLGACVGSSPFINEFVKDKVHCWRRYLKELTTIAKYEPHAAHAAFIHGLKHQWSFVQRTVKGAEVGLDDLEAVIRNEYIPALLGRHVSDAERDMLALPASLGGAAIDNPAKDSSHKYEASKAITGALTALVVNQETSKASPDTTKIKNAIKKANSERQKVHAQELLQTLPPTQASSLVQAQMKGASAIVTAKPLAIHGFHLAKQDFRDAMLLRYGWPIHNLPSTCACGNAFNIDHSQICSVGGFVHMRHNNIRDLIVAGQMREAYVDVQVEPMLAPLSGESLQPRTVNVSDDARSNIRHRPCK
ncbi:MAG: hypothetical protein AAGJ57_11130, partial [Pseudomonadota bacterium]